MKHQMVLWLATAILASGCISARLSRPPPARGPVATADLTGVSGLCSGWNVLLITIDALRTDHLSSHGYGRMTTPVIDRVADQGIDFGNCFVQAPHTHASMASLMTGMYPFRHESVIGSRKLSQAHETMAECLEKRKYATGAFVFNYWLSREMGFAQGFRNYNYLNQDLSDQTVERSIKEWISGQGDTPFFLWLHYLEPHAGYIARNPFFDSFMPGYKGNRDEFTNEMLNQHRIAKQRLKKKELAYIIGCYDSEIRCADASIGRILDHLDSAGKTSNTLVIITADHGEEFQDHGSLGHDHTLFDELLHVPLIMRAPDVLPTGRSPVPVQSIDLYASIMDLLGIPTPITVQGHTVFTGHPEEEITERYAYAQRYFIAPETHLVSFRAFPWKLIMQINPIDRSDFNHWSPDAKRDAIFLYNLAVDPREQTNVADENPGKVDVLIRCICDLLEKNRRSPVRSVREIETDLDEDTRAKLRSLGYSP